MSFAKNLLRSKTTSAVALLRAADIVLGAWHAWEPETIWLELEHQDVAVPAEARDRLMAGLALLHVPSFYWDANVFEKTCIAFDGRPANVEILEEAIPAAMAWGVVESDWIRERHGDEDLHIEHEPTAYTAVVLDRAGFVLAPTQLAFAQETLERRILSPDLLSDTRRRWNATDKARLADIVLHETRIDVQIARLAAVELHVRTRRAEAEAELSQLA